MRLLLLTRPRFCALEGCQVSLGGIVLESVMAHQSVLWLNFDLIPGWILASIAFVWVLFW